ncbi:AbrB/MazE/SpoVT family DNA-binding domain-containing protein [Rhodoplanes sp. TEM]|uniref:AbrB/MazE/SpoVT family DNA-binding domain-containing protein n=1 Tax=Rhodoplanes tepidamans TaxID=200616 RepID=A0ABT5J9T8_RHOTP|nr:MULTISPECIES: AbrB/MazE/SpoVT family DNA-binding domain-containing protein [Rhodoplanes]MDC7786430.1 AbrB/MazE/SpoVT family DNA-binding domain-containing protein [Rhodoplanes tepidamans]MDC7985072.1 AbrB/MazE/SpoVT family DNA-binding domain-containing protein [Rhodoplanes sp. TEM]MDQ0357315.1 antitoxin MazE [Rhodoplanes tepidamans]
MQVAKWGDSLAVRLPKEVVEALGLAEGDSVEIRVAGPGTFEIASAPTVEDILAQMRRFHGGVPGDGTADAGDDDAQGRLF